jgi:rhodanese-related sulfurtransferase
LKDKQIMVYCHAGNRSLAAGQILVKNGFTKIINLKSGITGWQGMGYPVAR